MKSTCCGGSESTYTTYQERWGRSSNLAHAAPLNQINWWLKKAIEVYFRDINGYSEFVSQIHTNLFLRHFKPIGSNAILWVDKVNKGSALHRNFSFLHIVKIAVDLPPLPPFLGCTPSQFGLPFECIFEGLIKPKHSIHKRKALVLFLQIFITVFNKNKL